MFISYQKHGHSTSAVTAGLVRDLTEIRCQTSNFTFL